MSGNDTPDENVYKYYYDLRTKQVSLLIFLEKNK